MNPRSASASPRAPLTRDERALIAIDLGAESCRVSLLRWHEGLPAWQLVHRFANATVERGGHLHWPLAAILDGLEHGLRLCAGLAREGVRSIAVDGWAVDSVRLDLAGSPLDDPFCYRDERTIAAETQVHQRIPAERMRDLTAIQIFRINTVYQHFADSTDLQRCRWLNLPEYVLHWLGAPAVSERTNASHTQMLGSDGGWSQEIFNALGWDVKHAPPLVDPGTRIGRLQGPLAALPALADTELIAPACHDTASAIAGVPDCGDDWAYISSGTWSLVGTLLSQVNNSAAARAGNFTNLRGAEGRICFHKNVNGMWLLRGCIAHWAEAGDTVRLEDVLAACEVSEAPSIFLDVDDEDLLLPGSMPQRINAQLVRRGHAAIDDKVQLAALVLHSLAARYAEVLGDIAAITGKKFSRLYIFGGGSRNTLLNRLTAEACRIPVVAGAVESSTIGNFAVQLATLEGGAVATWSSLLAAS